ncbi:TIGR00730 family Rossman fold protein [Ancylobacter mangrovi]|uniref:Cytokinin riboside 5'-monophosphate phosphoribohydrolase n=1 Tax=Ancylobacter mangrovi TaxID=2972472 RepID=A0A9X2PHN3_9HYPH|nr:TIGR00730 family Rossman fold protein [Ancylobacter mangrovi]MCS0496353.1 TIGR00730 family Rossman fold protein [Ancylobacter mangrovi]MCS0504365.1 TIGR00730 family Rossman fold protein [Ancylobacter mangrovi]
MSKIRSVCVYCGAAPGDDSIYIDSAIALGHQLAREGIRLIYGGGGVGLMGATARACAEAGGMVTGIIPDFLIGKEQAFEHAHELVVTKDMHERKRLMFERADAFIALPGGIGTLEELVEQMTWVQLNRHRKPVMVLNIAGFWKPLLTLIDHMQTTGFINGARPVRLLVANEVSAVLPQLQSAVATVAEGALHGEAEESVLDRM